MILFYLAAIVLANWSITHFGPDAQYVNAFLFIGVSIVVRDRLHDRWQDKRLLKMTGLIVFGAVLSYVINPAGGQIALAGAVAFAAMESVDAVVYQACRFLPWLERSNISNIPAAITDSIVFPTIAFGVFSATATLGQFTAKVAGALVFSLLFAAHMRRRQVAVA
jgi:uncharacterized PurR-regulated membrane protein YhhQ (DUF165 family)